MLESTREFVQWVASILRTRHRLDISSSGLALLMDICPTDDSRLHVRNTYLHADMYVRNMVRLDCGVRVGCEFVHRLEWEPERVKNLRRESCVPKSAGGLGLGRDGAGRFESIGLELLCPPFGMCSASTRARARSPKTCARPLKCREEHRAPPRTNAPPGSPIPHRRYYPGRATGRSGSVSRRRQLRRDVRWANIPLAPCRPA